MQKILLLVLFITLHQFSNAQGQRVDILRKNSLSEIREFRTQLGRLALLSPAATDSLQLTLSTMLNITRSIKDTTQLILIDQYFSYMKALVMVDTERNVTEVDYNAVLSGINTDLKYRILQNYDPGLKVNEKFSFGKEKPVTVNAYIDGKHIDTTGYRLYWAYFTGRAVKFLIKNHGSNGFSSGLSNPYTVKILLPASYVTFWLVDTNNPQLIYLPEFNMIDLVTLEPTMEINFKKTQ